MGLPIQDPPEYYIWRVPGKPIEVHLHLDVMDRLGAEVMRGFGAVRKRGAEVGGILIGSVAVEGAGPAIVRVEDFEPVACSYSRGPSYLFIKEEREVFARACERWKPTLGSPDYLVGYYRSHTRDGLALSPEDVELLDQYLAGPHQVALLVKPFGTKPSVGGFFFREEERFQESTPLEFPFRRREVTGADAPPHRPLTGRRTHPGEATAEITHESLVVSAPPPRPLPAPSPARSWSFPLTLAFLSIGLALGYLMAIMLPSRNTIAATDYSSSLAVSRTEENLMVKWNREAPAIRAAQKGVLEIDDGGNTKSVNLDQASLLSGSIVYRNVSNSVRFRLVLYLAGNLTLTESSDWKQ